MKRIRLAGSLLAIVILLLLCCSIAAYGMEVTPPQKEQSGQKEPEPGQSAVEMTTRNTEYERIGEEIIAALEAGIVSDGWLKTEVCFDSLEDAHSFGKYFYRYIYLGKEPVTLYSANTGGSYYIYLTCADPGAAALQHTQVLDRLSQVAEESRDMGDWEKAEYFYSWVYDNMSYDQTLQKKTVYDGVMEGTTVCWGYVSAYLTLCRSAGLVCEPVYRGNHAWNRVWLDGQWRHCDITWDKNLGRSAWKFLTEEEMDSDATHNAL